MARQSKKQDNKLTTNTTVDTKEIKAEAAKALAPEAVKEEAVDTEASVKKTAEKKTVAKKDTEKKKDAEKAPAKKTVTPHIVIQYDGSESTVGAIVEKITSEYVSEGHRASSIKDLKVYLKPEDGLAYYVINEKVAGSVSLF